MDVPALDGGERHRVRVLTKREREKKKHDTTSDKHIINNCTFPDQQQHRTTDHRTTQPAATEPLSKAACGGVGWCNELATCRSHTRTDTISVRQRAETEGSRQGGRENEGDSHE